MDIKNNTQSNKNLSGKFDPDTSPMPCGKYKGLTIKELPDNYLKWVSENWAEDPAFDTPYNHDIQAAAENEYEYRVENDITITADESDEAFNNL